MKILFIHQNFPGQFKHLAPAIASISGNEVTALTMQKIESMQWQGIRVIPYAPSKGTATNVHPWVMDWESKIIRAEACFVAASKLKDTGYTPDLIIAHSGWGESLFLKDVWPDAKLGVYSEFYYHVDGADLNFDPEFQEPTLGSAPKIRLKNLNNQMHFEIADAGIAPTHWQASTFPEPFRSKITVVHDGIDTESIKPNESISITFNDGLTLSKGDEVITFVSRNLEPYRGYHIFMRSLPLLLKERPHARVLIVGGDEVSYGPSPSSDQSWKDQFIQEVRGQISDVDWKRIHFLGKLPYDKFIALLQLATVHVYLTYPFVLSWSLLEAMSIGAAIVASDTAPVREVIAHGKTGRLVDFFDAGTLAKEVIDLLGNPVARKKLGAAARKYAVENYDLQSVCLPQQLAWVEGLFKKQYKSTKKIIAKKETIKTKAKVIGLKS